MTDIRNGRFRSGAWFILVSILVCLALAAFGEADAKFPGNTPRHILLRAIAIAVPLLPAIALSQHIIRARSCHPPFFTIVLAALIVAAIGALEFLTLILFATFVFAPSAPM